MTKSNPSSALNDLQKKYVASLPLRLKHVQEYWDNLKQVNWSEKNLSNLYTLVHQMAGSGSTFGFEALSSHARELEMMLLPLVESGLPPSANDKAAIERKLKLLLAAGEQKPTIIQAPSPSPHKEKSGCIFVVDDDPVSLTYFEVVLEDLGYEVYRFQYLKDVYAALEHRRPDLVIMDVVLTEGKMAGIDAIRKVRALSDDQLPVLVVSARTDFVAKLKAVREGANGFLIKPISDVQILKTMLAENIPAHKHSDSHVLVIDDDEYLAENLVHALRAAGYPARAIHNPAEIFKALEQKLPKVIVMDYHMPHCSGVELAEMLRHDERYMMIPVVFLSTEKNTEIQQQAVSITGNDFLVKPVDQAKLLEVLAKVIKRSSYLRSQINSVSQYQLGARLVNREWFFNELDSVTARAKNEPEACYLAYVSLDKTEFLRERLGWAGVSDFIEQFGHWLSQSVGEGHFVSQCDHHAYLLLTRPYSPLEADEFCQGLVARAAKKVFAVSESEVGTTISLAYYRITEDTRQADVALSQVEEGAQAVVKLGGNRAELWPRARSAAVSRTTDVDDVISAAVRNKAFKLVYQPIVNLDTSEKFFEVLMRLQDAQGNLLLPDQFMPYVAQRQLQFELDRWVFENAVKALLVYGAKEQQELTLFVKLAPTEKDLNRYIPFISNVLRNSTFRGQQKIYVQVSESWALTNQDRLQKNIMDLRALGCGFLLDRAGAHEHSSALIQRLHPDYIRLDKTLIHLFSTSRENQGKIAKLLEAAKQCDVKIIAGAVEDAATFAQLWGLGVRYFQGYFIQHPDAQLNFDPVDL